MIVLPLTVAGFNLLKTVLITILLTWGVERLFSLLLQDVSQFDGRKRKVIRWTEKYSHPLLLHGKVCDKKTFAIIVIVSLVFWFSEASLDYGVGVARLPVFRMDEQPALNLEIGCDVFHVCFPHNSSFYQRGIILGDTLSTLVGSGGFSRKADCERTVAIKNRLACYSRLNTKTVQQGKNIFIGEVREDDWSESDVREASDSCPKSVVNITSSGTRDMFYDYMHDGTVLQKKTEAPTGAHRTEVTTSIQRDGCTESDTFWVFRNRERRVVSGLKIEKFPDHRLGTYRLTDANRGSIICLSDAKNTGTCMSGSGTDYTMHRAEFDYGSRDASDVRADITVYRETSWISTDAAIDVELFMHTFRARELRHQALHTYEIVRGTSYSDDIGGRLVGVVLDHRQFSLGTERRGVLAGYKQRVSLGALSIVGILGLSLIPLGIATFRMLLSWHRGYGVTRGLRNFPIPGLSGTVVRNEVEYTYDLIASELSNNRKCFNPPETRTGVAICVSSDDIAHVTIGDTSDDVGDRRVEGKERRPMSEAGFAYLFLAERGAELLRDLSCINMTLAVAEDADTIGLIYSANMEDANVLLEELERFGVQEGSRAYSNAFIWVMATLHIWTQESWTNRRVSRLYEILNALSESLSHPEDNLESVISLSGGIGYLEVYLALDPGTVYTLIYNDQVPDMVLATYNNQIDEGASEGNRPFNDEGYHPAFVGDYSEEACCSPGPRAGEADFTLGQGGVENKSSDGHDTDAAETKHKGLDIADNIYTYGTTVGHAREAPRAATFCDTVSSRRGLDGPEDGSVSEEYDVSEYGEDCVSDSESVLASTYLSVHSEYGLTSEEINPCWDESTLDSMIDSLVPEVECKLGDVCCPKHDRQVSTDSVADLSQGGAPSVVTLAANLAGDNVEVQGVLGGTEPGTKRITGNFNAPEIRRDPRLLSALGLKKVTRRVTARYQYHGAYARRKGTGELDTAVRIVLCSQNLALLEVGRVLVLADLGLVEAWVTLSKLRSYRSEQIPRLIIYSNPESYNFKTAPESLSNWLRGWIYIRPTTCYSIEVDHHVLMQ